MNRVNKILQHLKYKEYVAKIEAYEKNRIFCRHDMSHFLNVCRLSQILYQQEYLELESQRKDVSEEDREKKQWISGLVQNKNIEHEMVTEWIYAAGLLHDIGRWQEYENGIRHEMASAGLAPEILKECGFSNEECGEILLAIRNHRNKNVKDEKSLSGILYRADKMSRACFCCKAEAECDWDLQKKNKEIIF